MAITILQEPTSPNVSNTNLIYTVSSSNVPQFQYRYIADLYESGSATKLATFKYPQNSSGTANIDLGRPIGDYLDTDYNWTNSQFSSDSSSYKPFIIEFGEEYGTSYTSTVTEFTNQVSASISVFQGNIQYPSIGNFDGITNTRTYATSSINFNYVPYVYTGSLSSGFIGETMEFSDDILTNDPNKLNSPATAKYWNDEDIDFTNNWLDDGKDRRRFYIGDNYYNSSSIGWYVAKPIGTNDYETLSHFRPDPSIAYDNFRYSIYNDNNTLIAGDFIQASLDKKIISTLQVGISDLTASISSSNQWSWYAIEFFNTTNPFYGNPMPQFYYNEDKGADTLLSANISVPDVAAYTATALPGGGIKPSVWKSGKYYPKNCNNEKTRFAFVNSFGVWDYYNVYMPTLKNTSIDRKMYSQEQINLNDRIATYNVSNRGDKQYYTEYTDTFEITTDTLDDKESQWIREMFDSSDVFIQSGSDFIPIVITNTSEQINNNKYRNKNFRYTIRYQFSNLREPR